MNYTDIFIMLASVLCALTGLFVFLSGFMLLSLPFYLVFLLGCFILVYEDY
jgi:hypothetical protein